MKNNKFKLFLSVLVFGGVLFTSCADLTVQNTNEPTTEAVFGDPANLTKLLRGGFYDWSTAVVSSYGTHPDLIADQITSTNNVRNFWDFAQEPRIRLANTTSYGGAASWRVFYGGFNSAITTANLFIANPDTPDDFLAQAYFLRGVARGYLGMFFDQGYLIDEDFDASTDTPEFVPYGQIIDGAIADLDQAISLAASTSATFSFNAMPNPAESWDSDEFQDVVNSFAARILAGEARTEAEAASTDWQAVLDYAEAGIGGPDALSSIGVFSNSNIGSSGEFANYYADWSNFIVSCGSSVSSCSGYLPTDVKVTHSMDPSYPTTYPTAQANGTTADLAPASSTDPRLDGYYVYTTNAGFLRSTRNPDLYSNYFSGRLWSGNDWWQETNDVILFTDTETDLLRAEAQVMLNQGLAAANTLNNSTAGTGTTTIGFTLYSETNNIVADATLSGGYNFTGTETKAQQQFALMREYAVEVAGLGGAGTNWAFMRRHDLLQEGTMTMFPVPGTQLEILGIDIYTFGGVENAGTAGTASGANSWTALAAKAGLAKARPAGDNTFTPNNAKIDASSINTLSAKGAKSN